MNDLLKIFLLFCIPLNGTARSLVIGQSDWTYTQYGFYQDYDNDFDGNTNMPPRPAYIITREQIIASQARDLTQLLAQVNGISVSSSGGYGSKSNVFIRGTDASQTLILIDGVRVGGVTSDSTTLNAYPIEAVDRVEVTKGSMAGLYGATAAGGVIKIFTKNGYHKYGYDRFGYQGEAKSISTTLGSNGLHKIGAVVSIPGRYNDYDGKVSPHSYLGVNYKKTQGVDHTKALDNGNDDRDGYKEKSINFGKSYYFDRGYLSLAILGTQNKIDLDNPRGIGNNLYSHTKTRNYALTFHLEDAIQKGLGLTTSIGSNMEKRIINNSTRKTYVTERETLNTELPLVINPSKPLSAPEKLSINMKIGVDFYREQIKSTQQYSTMQWNNKAVYLQLKPNFNQDNWALSANLRYDNNSAYGNYFNSALAASYSPNDTMSIMANHGTGFVAPTFDQLHQAMYGDTSLFPEKSRSSEIGFIHHEWKTINWHVFAYYTTIENAFTINPESARISNGGDAEIKGLDFSVQFALDTWRILLRADLLSAKDKQNNTKLEGRPERTLALGIDRTFLDYDLHLRLDAKHEQGRHYKYRKGMELPGSVLVDLSAAYKITPDLTLSAKVSNLLDRDNTFQLINSEERYNTEGRHAELTLRYTF